MSESDLNILSRFETGGAGPVVGITCDVEIERDRFFLYASYVNAVQAAGAVALIVPPVVESLPQYLQLCDAWILSGGDDPIMESFGEPTHSLATPIDPRRQAFEVALLNALNEDRRDVPALGICLGMQLMSLVAGGKLDQYLPNSLPTHELHWGKKPHPVGGSIGEGEVLSHHRQAIADPGALDIIGRAPDGVIEAVRDPRASTFRVGVQWHPERTDRGELGSALFEQLVGAACARTC